MKTLLNDVKIRVLGSLVEKEITTPDYYLLSLNSLVTACKQKSNREPVVSYDEATVTAALDILREKDLVIVLKLPRQIGHKECRCAHLLAGEEGIRLPENAGQAGGAIDGERIEYLEQQIECMRQDLDELMSHFAEFRKQFE
ncbi:MAG: DUF480 domain-containing protein [Armatimonadetes bacterium]|nr:DUF480 domain-containing protein [Armatimonadota bacterium]